MKLITESTIPGAYLCDLIPIRECSQGVFYLALTCTSLLSQIPPILDPVPASGCEGEENDSPVCL